MPIRLETTQTTKQTTKNTTKQYTTNCFIQTPKKTTKPENDTYEKWKHIMTLQHIHNQIHNGRWRKFHELMTKRQQNTTKKHNEKNKYSKPNEIKNNAKTRILKKLKEMQTQQENNKNTKNNNNI